MIRHTLGRWRRLAAALLGRGCALHPGGAMAAGVPAPPAADRGARAKRIGAATAEAVDHGMPPAALVIGQQIRSQLELARALWLGGAHSTAHTLLAQARQLESELPAIDPGRALWQLRLRNEIHHSAALLRRPAPAPAPDAMPLPGRPRRPATPPVTLPATLPQPQPLERAH